MLQREQGVSGAQRDPDPAHAHSAGSGEAGPSSTQWNTEKALNGTAKACEQDGLRQ